MVSLPKAQRHKGTLQPIFNQFCSDHINIWAFFKENLHEKVNVKNENGKKTNPVTQFKKTKKKAFTDKIDWMYFFSLELPIEAAKSQMLYKPMSFDFSFEFRKFFAIGRNRFAVKKKQHGVGVIVEVSTCILYVDVITVFFLDRQISSNQRVLLFKCAYLFKMGPFSLLHYLFELREFKVIICVGSDIWWTSFHCFGS